MAGIGILEAKTQLSRMVDRALAGEDITLTRHGKALVRLVPVHAPPQQQARLQALVSRILRERAKQPARAEPSARTLIEEGRR